MDTPKKIVLTDKKTINIATIDPCIHTPGNGDLHAPPELELQVPNDGTLSQPAHQLIGPMLFDLQPTYALLGVWWAPKDQMYDLTKFFQIDVRIASATQIELIAGARAGQTARMRLQIHCLYATP